MQVVSLFPIQPSLGKQYVPHKVVGPLCGHNRMTKRMYSWGCGPVGQPLPSTYEALGFILSIRKTKQNKIMEDKEYDETKRIHAQVTWV